jgi:hypothetical protein
MKIVMIFMFAMIVSCKPSQVTTRTHFVKDSIITHETKTVQLPVKNVTIIEHPCKDSTLQPINQTISSGNTHVTIKEDSGNLIAEINIDSIVNSDLKEFQSHINKEKEVITITKKVIPKWLWYILGANFLYILYRVGRLYIPLLKLLPY